MTPTEAPPCPACGCPTRARRSRSGGAFWGCAAWPACRGLVDADDRSSSERVRDNLAAASRLLRRIAAGWSADDRDDALQQAALGAVEGGRIDHPAEARSLALVALRTLRGWQKVRGLRASCRNGATPAASPGYRLIGEGAEAEAEVGPDGMLDAVDLGPAYPAPDAAIDLARRLEGAPADEPIALSPLGRDLAAVAALPAGERRRIAADLGVDLRGLAKWLRGDRAVPPAKVARLRLLARGAGAPPA